MSGSSSTSSDTYQSYNELVRFDASEKQTHFKRGILMDSTRKLQFRDDAIYLKSSTDGQLDIVADDKIALTTGADAITITSAGKVDTFEVVDVAVDVANDHIYFADHSNSNKIKRDSIGDFATAFAGTGLNASSGQLTNNSTKVTVTTADITLDQSHNGSNILIMALGAHRTYTLPAPVANYRIKFVAAQNNLTYNITVKTAAASHRIIGLFARIDHKAENEHGYHTDSFSGSNTSDLTAAGDGQSGQNNQFVIAEIVQGSVFEMFSDGTRWYVWGHLVSAQADVNPDVTATFSLYS